MREENDRSRRRLLCIRSCAGGLTKSGSFTTQPEARQSNRAFLRFNIKQNAAPAEQRWQPLFHHEVKGSLNRKKGFSMKLMFKLCALILVSTLLYWWLRGNGRVESGHARLMSPPPQLVPFRTAGGTLHTNGFMKTEMFHNETSTWLGTTSSSIRLNATYRYEIELRNKWNILIDDTRKLAFVIAPPFRPQLPVAVDSGSVVEWTESGWGRFNKWEHLGALRRETSTHLEKLAMSIGYIEVARGQARITVEEFVTDWLLRTRGWPEHSECFVKVYFADEQEIPFPDNKSVKDFLP